jgi:hypothetical protein
LEALVKPKYLEFCDKRGKCLTTRYETLRHNIDPKKSKDNSSVDTWRLSPEVVKENEGIVNFKESKKNIWIQSRRDPKKTWLKIQYCITNEEVQWVIKEWPDQWKVPVVGMKGTKEK